MGVKLVRESLNEGMSREYYLRKSANEPDEYELVDQNENVMYSGTRDSTATFLGRYADNLRDRFDAMEQIEKADKLGGKAWSRGDVYYKEGRQKPRKVAAGEKMLGIPVQIAPYKFDLYKNLMKKTF